MEVEQGWSPPTCTSTGVCPSSAARQLGLHHNVLVHETAVSQNQDDNLVHHNNANAGPSTSSFLNLEPVDGISNVARFRSSVCSSGSSSHMDGRTEGSSSSLAAWDSLSSKRKALEGTSGQLNPSASSSGILQAENFTWPNEAPHCDSPHPVNLSQLSSWSSHNDNFLGNFSVSNVLRVRGTTLDPRGSVDGGGSLGPQQEPFPSNLSTSTLSSVRNSRHSSGLSPSHWPCLSSSFLDVRSTRGDLANTGVSQITQSNAIQTPQLPRNISGYPWIGSQHSGSSNFTCSVLPGGSPDEVNSGSMLSYNSENPVASSASQTRNIMQDPPSWDIAAGLTSHNLNSLPFSHRTGQGSSSHPLRSPFRTPCHMSREIRQVLELAPWTPESFDSQNNYLLGPLSSSGSSSSQQGSGGNSLCRSQQYHRPGFSVDREDGELLAMSESPLQAFTGDIERRNRVIAEIRQVLNAMNRGENLRAEDCMLFEPLMFQGLAEIHDQHRDMRLDVDNMSYEELLELEERIGDVSTGLKEETIMKFLKQNKKEIPTGTESVNGLEPCCICQEHYVGGEGTGELDCGHDFHVDCIKQWLMHKNRCPICKTTGLVT